MDEAAALRLVRREWCEVLCLPNVDPDDDFFGLGGHSLVMLQIINRIEEKTGAVVPLRIFFDDPTPRALAAVVAGARANEP